MTFKKKILLLFLLTILLLGHSLVRLAGDEWWPFSNYPMYSAVFKSDIIAYHEIWALDEEGMEEKLAVSKYFQPYNDRSLEEVFLYNKNPDRRQEIIEILHRWYEKQSSTKNWKKIRSLKLYKFEYNFSALKENQGSKESLLGVRNNPVRKTALHESKSD